MAVPRDPDRGEDVDGLVVRPAAASDLGRIVELLLLGAVAGTAESKEAPADLGPYQAALVAIQAGEGELLVAEQHQTVVGVCQLIVFRHLQYRGGRCAEIESVHVHPESRGRGIGTLLMHAAVRQARDLGCYRVQLTSNVVRGEAHRFYERLGFVPSHVGFKLALPRAPAPLSDDV